MVNTSLLEYRHILMWASAEPNSIVRVQPQNRGHVVQGTLHVVLAGQRSLLSIILYYYKWKDCKLLQLSKLRLVEKHFLELNAWYVRLTP